MRFVYIAHELERENNTDILVDSPCVAMRFFKLKKNTA